jgi:hypothetical protein
MGGIHEGSCVRLPDYLRGRFLRGECLWIVILYSESARAFDCVSASPLFAQDDRSGIRIVGALSHASR